MITQKDKETIQTISAKYHAKRVLLFGSSVDGEGHDIDLAVEGVEASDFYRFYGDLIFSLSKPVDLVDLSSKSKFNSLIQEDGVLLYG